MRRESLTVAGACLLGAFVGTLVALDISARFQYGSYLWGIGALFGGITAYVAVDFRQFISGICRAWREVANWQLNRPFWKAVFSLLGGFLALLASVCGMLFGLLQIDPVPSKSPLLPSLVAGFAMFLFLFSAFACFFHNLHFLSVGS